MAAGIPLLETGRSARFHKAAATLLRAMCRFCWRVPVRWAAPRSAYRQVCLYAGNHRSFLDPPIVGMHVHQATSYFARRSLWKLPIIGWVLSNVDGVPVDRGAPGLTSIKAAVEVLRGGHNLIIFPEGTRTRTGRLGRLRDGPAMIARRAGVPVVPVYIHHSERGWRPGWPLPSLDAPGMELRFGPPVRAPAQLAGRAQDAWLTAYLQAWLAAQERALQEHS